MGKVVAAVGALAWLFAVPATARNVAEDDKTEVYVVCSGCTTIFDKNPFLAGEPDPRDRIAVDAAFKKELGAAVVNAARFGKIVMGSDNRIKTVSLNGRNVYLGTASRQEDGTFKVVRSNAVESLVSDWAAWTTTDALHDSPRVVLSTEAEERAGSLMFICVDNKIDVIVRWAKEIGSATEQDVQWRIDGKPVVSESWAYSSNDRSMVSPRPMPLFKDMLEAKKFVIRVRLHGGLDRTMSVSMAGVDEFLAILRRTCSW